MDISERKIKMINELSSQGLDKDIGKKVISVRKSFISDFVIFSDKDFLKKFFDEDSIIVKDKTTTNHIIIEEITIKDLFNYISLLHEQSLKKETNIYIQTKNIPALLYREKPAVLKEEERSELNVFNMLDLND